MLFFLVRGLVMLRRVRDGSRLVVVARVVLGHHRGGRAAALFGSHIAGLLRSMIRTQSANMRHMERIVGAHVVLGLDHGRAIAIAAVE